MNGDSPGAERLRRSGFLRSGVPAPPPLAALKDKPVRFRETVTRDHMVDQVLEMLR